MSTKYRYTTDPGSLFDDYVVNDVNFLRGKSFSSVRIDEAVSPKKKDEFWDKLPHCPECFSPHVRPHRNSWTPHGHFDSALNRADYSHTSDVFTFKCKSCGNEWAQRRTYADGLISVLRKEVDGFKL